MSADQQHTAEKDAAWRSETAWRDRQGDVWRMGADGLMHTPETAPFRREYVEKKWGPLTRVTSPGVDQ